MNLKVNTTVLIIAAFLSLTILSAVGMNGGWRAWSHSSSDQNQYKATAEKAPAENFILPVDTPPEDPNAINLHYPIYDRVTDFLTTPNENSFDLDDPSNINQDIEYDPQSQQYIINETIGEEFYRDPTYMSFEDFLEYQYKTQEQQYWQQRSSAAEVLSQKSIIPDVNVNNRLFDRIFGGTKVDIRPQGNIDLTFGGNYQNILNPTLTKRQRKQGGFNFDMNIQMNVLAKIGDKLKMNVNYNTQSNFNFENQVKLEYTGYQDEVIKKIEAGNISLPLKGSLITGSQSLFGLKTQLQFGRLTVTSVISQQQSQTQSLTVQGGAQQQTFRITSDQYDENRNYYLAQYFRDHYNQALSTIPIINSQVSITKIEVWVTNKTGATTNVRDIVAFQDLGEMTPFSPLVHNTNPSNILPYGYSPLISGIDLNSNDLYPNLTNDPNLNGARYLDNTLQTLTTYGFIPVQDFEKTYARKLATNEYTFDPRIGWVMLNSQLQPDDVLAVAYQYTVNGQLYQVGEFAEDVPPSADTAKVLFLKMLKSTSTRPKLPLWDLQMKNVYSLGAYQINPDDFFLDIYYLDPGGGEKRYIPADNLNGTPLISVLGLDRLNNNQDPQPDGVFDFLSGITIIPANGKVIFPVVEPFGKDLKSKFSNPAIGQQYVYQQLYDSTKTIAEQFPQYNRYVLQGTYKSSVSSEISLGAFNVPQGSVTVTAGGQKLAENVDYTVDYNLGRVRILNQGLLNSGVPINVAFENNALFSFQTKTLFGARFDYYINDHFTIGGTVIKLWERPYTTKLNVGYDPINNSIYGLDGSYTSEVPLITRIVNALPLIDTKEKSSITVSAEGARLQPGHSKTIGKEGVIYIDDFEGTQTTYDLRFPFISWKLASTPQDYSGGLFPEATHVNSWDYGFNRAKLSWYNIDPFFWRNTAPEGIRGNASEQNNFYTRQILQKEIFPAKAQDGQYDPLNQIENTFDLRYEPMRRGPYNFDTTGLIVLKDGNIGFDTASAANITKRWGGIQRSIDQTDFEQANIEYIQLWVLDPFLYDVNSAGGDLYIDLGNISEDVLKDSKFFYENGLSPSGDISIENESIWGYSPKIPPITNAFDNDPNARQWQDVGYDGLRDVSVTPGTGDEQRFFTRYLTALQTIYGANSPIYQAALSDPCYDDYKYFDDATYNSAQTGILDRYQRYNNPENNSPISSTTQVISSAATNQPESEDLNNDNTITENEEYFQYKVHISPGGLGNVGQNFVTDQITYAIPPDPDNNFTPGTERWIQIKIPISSYEKRVGSIEDFKSIRFVRMYLTGFDTTVIMRFARVELVRNQWRKYLFSLEQPGEYIPGDNSGNTYFNVTSVSLEENSQRQPVNYVLPPGIQREQIVGQIGTQFQNEQSLSVQICNLPNGDARAVYKNINLDLRQYQHLQLFVHAEAVEGQGLLNNGDLNAFIRLGSDFTNNFYEYEIPLSVTPPGDYNPNSITDRGIVWPAINNFDIVLSELVATKQARNAAGFPVNKPYTINLVNGTNITIVGNPDLGIVVTAMLGVRNPTAGGADDDGNPKCAEIWYDELRLSGFTENGGNAAIARTEIKLADLGNIALAGSFHTIGFGQIEQKLNERFKDNFYAYDATTTLALGKFFPKKLGLQLPMYAGISKQISNPQYDPYDHDILLADKLDLITDPQARNEARKAAQTYVAIGSINFSNVRIQPLNKNSKIRIYSPQNLNLTYAYTRTFSHTPIISANLLQNHHAELGYAFPGKSKFITPFEKLIPSKSKYLKIIRDINFNFLPTNLSFRTAMDRQFGELFLRPLTQDEIIIPTYNKYWTWDRYEGFKFDISKGLNLDFNAATRTRIDEPDGRINTSEKKDSVWKNIKQLGRTTNYTHSANVNYTLPINKIPILDWTQVTARYGSNYTWFTGPLVLDTASQRIILSPLGNSISNNQNISLNGDLNIRNLYNKVKFLKRYDTNVPHPKEKSSLAQKQKENAEKDKKPADQEADAKNAKSKTKAIGPEAFFIRLPLMLKRVSATYTEAHSTTLPGYLPKPKFIGQDFTRRSPGWGFIFGYQPDSNWLNDAATKGWISSDTTLNYLFVQTTQKQMNLKATFEPFRDFNIDVNFSRTNGSNLSEYFKKPTANSPFRHLSRTEYGNFTMSYVAIKTSFVPIQPNQFSATFLQFQEYREIISQRLQATNSQNSQGAFNDLFPQYRDGYGPYSQDVLIPAFLAAYTGKDPNQVDLGLPFNKLPLPNWRVQYNGVTKMTWAKKIWTSVNISHSYTSTLAIGSFTSSLNFRGQGPSQPSFQDPTSNNFVSFYDIPVIAISEQFAPLLGIDMTWKNSLTTKVEYKRARNLSFSFFDYQLTEARTSEFTGGIGYKFRRVPIPFKIKGKKKTLKNDLNFQMNVSYTDNTIYSQKLDQDVASQPTSGTETISFSPAVDYTVNGRLNVRVFFDKRITNPKISSSYPIRYTDGGVTLRFTLGQ